MIGLQKKIGVAKCTTKSKRITFDLYSYQSKVLNLAVAKFTIFLKCKVDMINIAKSPFCKIRDVIQGISKLYW